MVKMTAAGMIILTRNLVDNEVVTYPPTPNPPRTDIPIPKPWFPALTAANAPTPAVIIEEQMMRSSRFAPWKKLNPQSTRITPLAAAYPNGMIVRATR